MKNRIYFRTLELSTKSNKPVNANSFYEMTLYGNNDKNKKDFKYKCVIKKYNSDFKFVKHFIDYTNELFYDDEEKLTQYLYLNKYISTELLQIAGRGFISLEQYYLSSNSNFNVSINEANEEGIKKLIRELFIHIFIVLDNTPTIYSLIDDNQIKKRISDLTDSYLNFIKFILTTKTKKNISRKQCLEALEDIISEKNSVNFDFENICCCTLDYNNQRIIYKNGKFGNKRTVNIDKVFKRYYNSVSRIRRTASNIALYFSMKDIHLNSAPLQPVLVQTLKYVLENSRKLLINEIKENLSKDLKSINFNDNNISSEDLESDNFSTIMKNRFELIDKIYVMDDKYFEEKFYDNLTLKEKEKLVEYTNRIKMDIVLYFESINTFDDLLNEMYSRQSGDSKELNAQCWIYSTFFIASTYHNSVATKNNEMSQKILKAYTDIYNLQNLIKNKPKIDFVVLPTDISTLTMSFNNILK